MNTKSKYNAKEVLKEIENKTRAFMIGHTTVIYCIDTDDFDKNYEREQEFKAISTFCKERSYELIWFCRDVEEVFWGKKLSDSQKVKEAAIFRRKGLIAEIQSEYLRCDTRRKRTSNMLNVLDKYLSRREA